MVDNGDAGNKRDDRRDDEWMNGERSKRTGRFVKGRSGNLRGRPKKSEAGTLPFEVAREVLAAGQAPIEIKGKGGRAEKLPAISVVLRQLSLAAAKGDKTAARLFMTHTTAAARTLEQRAQLHYERLGAYLKSLDEGRPWRLDQAEAEFLQRVADEAGYKIAIRAYDAADGVPPLTNAEIEAIDATPNVWRTLGRSREQLSPSDRAEIIRRIIHAYRKRREERASAH